MTASSKSYLRLVLRRAGRNWAVAFFLLCLVGIVSASALAPWIAPADPTMGNALHRLAPLGSPAHPLGTDELGRDMLSRLVYGGRTSLALGITPVVLALLV